MGGSVPSGIRSVYCRANTWTTVLELGGVFLGKVSYVIRVGDNLVEYRRYAVSPLVYWPGTFRTIDTFNLWYWEGYMRVEIKPGTNINVEVERIPST